MYQIDNSTAAAAIPASTSAGAPGFFTDGNAATGVPATILPAEFMNMLMMENLNLLSAAGLLPSKTNFSQLATAIRTINQFGANSYGIDSGAPNVVFATFSPAITALTDGMVVRVLMSVAGNTGSMTMSVGTGQKPVVGLAGQPLQGGETVLGGRATFMWAASSNAWILLSCQGGALQVAPATRTLHSLQMGQFQSAAGTFATDTGSTNVIFAVFTPVITALTGGMVVRVLMSASGNNGATTMSVGTGQKPVLGLAGQPLQGGELVLGGLATFMYAAAQDSFILLSCQAAALQVKAGTASLHAVNRSQLGNYNSYAPIGANTAFTAANLGQAFLVQVAGTTQTLPPVANCPAGTTITFALNGSTTIKGNASELITNTLGTSSPNTMVVLAGEQIQLTSTGTSWVISSYTQVSGKLIGVQTLVASGTYTPTPGMGSVVMELQGGGGSGAGATVPSAGNVSLGAPGGAGSYGKWRFFAASIGASQVVTIGAAGTVGSGVAGGNGGTTSVGALASAPGGVGGSLLNNQVPPQYNGNGTASGNPTGASISISIGVAGAPSAAPVAGSGTGGIGGSSAFGAGGLGSSINSVGNPAPNYGAGGAGCVCGSGGAAITGALGKPGIAIFTEYA